MLLTSSGLMRDADDAAIHIFGVPSTLLMRNAAAHVARAARELLRPEGTAVVFCGPGNNGGDGAAAAAWLLLRGVPVRVLLVGPRGKMSPDTREMCRRLAELGCGCEDFCPDEPGLSEKLKNAGVIIDAIFGVGLSRELEGDALSAVRMINASGAPVVSADIASGVEADTGRILGEAVRADITVTFSMSKPGHFVQPGCVCRGGLRVADIGVPRELLDKCGSGVHAAGRRDVSLPRRERVSHKGDYGRLLLIGGSIGYTGAPALAARAAVRSGAGLVSLGVPEEIYRIEAVKNDEAMVFPLASREGKIELSAFSEISNLRSACDVTVIGMGLGRSKELSELTAGIVRDAETPIVVDADGLYALKDDLSAVSRSRGAVILTPHDGEFLRLGGELTGDRLGDAAGFAKKHGCILVLKGHRAICAFPDGEAHVIDAGNPGMAKGGTGDVLAGVLGAMLCQLPLERAVVTGCWLHARAGDICAGRFGEYSMTASDIIDALGEAALEITI